LVRVQPVDEEEGVRIIGPVHTAAPQEQLPPPEEQAVPADRGAATEQAGPGVEDLFARLRAERQQAVVRAEEVLAAEPHAPAEAEPTPEAERDLVPPPPVDEEQLAGQEAASHAAADDAGPGDDGFIRRRDECLEPVAADLVRRLKRVLQDEQNEILDRLRQSRGRTRVEEALPSAADQAGRYRDAAAEPLAAAARAGAELLGLSAPNGLPARTWASELGSELVTGLRDRVSRSLPAGDGEGNGEADVAEALGAVYRQWKTERVEQIARHHLSAAFNEGAFAAAPDGTSLRWVFGDAGPCPDCDDNVLAGVTPKGEAFPTGQLHPPAHAGCGCVIAVVGDAAR
jgi:hypothetical protein